MTLYKKISGGAIITKDDFQANVKCNSGKGGDFDSGYYAVNSNPHYPTHTFINGALMTFQDALDLGEKELNRSHSELNP